MCQRPLDNQKHGIFTYRTKNKSKCQMKLKQEQHLETAELHVEAVSLIHPHRSNIQYFRVRYDWKAK